MTPVGKVYVELLLVEIWKQLLLFGLPFSSSSFILFNFGAGCGETAKSKGQSSKKKNEKFEFKPNLSGPFSQNLSLFL